MTAAANAPSALPAPRDQWPALLQNPPWLNPQALPAMPALHWQLPLPPIQWDWTRARAAFRASASNGYLSNGYLSDAQWDSLGQAAPPPDWQARAQSVLTDRYDGPRIQRELQACAQERHFPADWPSWPPLQQLLLACGVPASQAARVAELPCTQAEDFSQPRIATHHAFASALPNALVVGYWAAFGGASSEAFSLQVERLQLADDALVPALLQTHRLPTGSDKLILAHAVGWPALAPWVASCLGGVKWRADLAQSWLNAHPSAAAAGLWPQALNPDAAQHLACWAALRHLLQQGHADTLLTQFQQGLQAAHASADIQAAWATALSRLNAAPEHCLPSPLPKLTKALAQHFAAADALQLKANCAPASAPDSTQANAAPTTPCLTLPPEAMDAALMTAMLCKPDAPYAGLAQLQTACTRESLARWGRSLYALWQAEGMPPKARFILHLQGWVGDDATAALLHKGIVLWRSKLDRVRAYDGIAALRRMGGNGALTWLNALAEHKRYDDLKTRARTALHRAAEQRGMGLDDLADCTLPDLGFDARSRQLLDFGPRQFELLLNEQLQLRLRELPPALVDTPTPSSNAPAGASRKHTTPPRAAHKPAGQGAWLKALPKPRLSDDAALATQVKRQLKDVQTQLKALGRRQLERMEAAMCEERRWPVAHFRQHLVAHPIARVLSQRLIFGLYPVLPPNTPKPELPIPIQLFRVADDGQPCNEHDDALSWDDMAAPLQKRQALPAHSEADAQEAAPACIGIVHPLALAAMPNGAALAQAHAAVLADYELLQPFEQLGREVSPMPDALLNQSRLHEWAGRQLSTGSLQGLMAQGWQREVGDGGMITSMHLPVQATGGQRLHIGVSFEPGWFVGAGMDPQEGQTLGAFELGGQVPSQTHGATDANAPLQDATWQDLPPIARSELLRKLRGLAWWAG